MSTYRYDVSRVVQIESAYPLDQLVDHQVEGIDEPDILVSKYTGGTPTGDRFGKYVWNEEARTVSADMGPRIRAQLRVTEDMITLQMTPLYFRHAQVERILLWAISHTVRRKGGVMLYAAGVEFPSGSGALLFGPPKTGKTTTATLLAREWNCRLLGDDKVLICDGDVYGFHKQLGVRRGSPLFDSVEGIHRNRIATSSRVSRATREMYTSRLPSWSGTFVRTVRSFLFGCPDQLFVPASTVAEIGDRASLETCLLLRPSEGRTEIRRIGLDEMVQRVTQLNLTDPGMNHDMVRAYAYCDGSKDFFLSFGDEQRTRELIRDCAYYEVRASTGDLCRVIADNFIARPLVEP